MSKIKLILSVCVWICKSMTSSLEHVVQQSGVSVNTETVVTAVILPPRCAMLWKKSVADALPLWFTTKTTVCIP